jgi:hypothetical protein
MDQPIPGPRPLAARLAVFAGQLGVLAAGWLAVTAAFLLGPLLRLDPGARLSDAEYDEAAHALALHWLPWILGVGAALQLAAFAALAGRVHYRARDTFLQFVPVFGIAFVLRVLWRWTDVEQWTRTPEPEPAAPLEWSYEDASP